MTCVAFQNGEVKRLLPSTSLSESPWASASTLLASLVRVTTLAVLVINSVPVQALGSPACKLGNSSGFCAPFSLDILGAASHSLCTVWAFFSNYYISFEELYLHVYFVVDI